MSINWDNVRHFDRHEFGGEPAMALVVMLDAARERAGIPFRITSGIRTKEHNEAVGGVENSAHLTGHAVDIACSNSANRYIIIDSLLAVGFKRIGVSEMFIHADCDLSKPQRMVWLY